MKNLLLLMFVAVVATLASCSKTETCTTNSDSLSKDSVIVVVDSTKIVDSTSTSK